MLVGGPSLLPPAEVAYKPVLGSEPSAGQHREAKPQTGGKPHHLSITTN